MSILLIIFVPVLLIGLCIFIKDCKYAEEKKQIEGKRRNWVEEGQRLFASELDSIERVNIVPSAPVDVSDIVEQPEHHLTSITKRTNIGKLFPLVVVDVETTGLSPANCEIIEVSAIKFDNGFVPVSCFTTLCKPRKPIAEKITAINHITNDMVADMPSFAEVAAPLSDYVAGYNVVGHNLKFDLDFLVANGVKFSPKVKFYDTFALAKSTLVSSYKSSDYDVVNHKLPTLCEYYGIYRTDAHRSLSDCLATGKILEKLIASKMSD